MRALLGHLGIGRAVIGGLSLGGTMSLAFYRAPSGDGPRPRHLRLGPGLPERRRARGLEPEGPASAPPSSRRAGSPCSRGGARETRAGHPAPHVGPGPGPRRARACSRRRTRASSSRCPTITRAHARHRRRPGHPVHRGLRVHGQEDPRREARGHRRTPDTPPTWTSPRPSTACWAASWTRCRRHGLSARPARPEPNTKGEHPWACSTGRSRW